MMTRDDASRKTERERVTRDSARTTAPEIRRPWLVRVVFIIVVLAIVTAILFAVRMGVGGRESTVSDPAPPASENFPAGASDLALSGQMMSARAKKM